MSENVQGAMGLGGYWLRWDIGGEQGSIELVDESTGEVLRLHQGDDVTTRDLEWGVWWLSKLAEGP